MATLDVLDYQVRLDEALVGRLGPAERKMALRESRRVVEDMAFRFAFIEERVMPEDIDYARALEAVKEPSRAADVLARRAPVYRRRRVRKGVTTGVVLLSLALLVGAFADLVTSERADVLVNEWRVGSAEPQTTSASQTFVVDPGTTRLQLFADVIVFRDRSGERENTITLALLDPSGTPRYEKTFTNANAVYARQGIDAPTPGEWTIFVDFRDAAGTAEVTVQGVVPR